jgi:hypothetical protein
MVETPPKLKLRSLMVELQIFKVDNENLIREQEKQTNIVANLISKYNCNMDQQLVRLRGLNPRRHKSHQKFKSTTQQTKIQEKYLEESTTWCQEAWNQ